MRKQFALLAIAAAIFSSSRGTVAQQKEVHIAAAADLQFAMADLSARFEKQTGGKVIATYGSSGNFFSQIQSGAPFDLFFSADTDYPHKLQDAGFVEPGTLTPYALGQIVIWLPAGAKIDAAQQQWRALLDPSVEKIAIANPEHAPYGRAAVSALQAAKIYDAVKIKLVYGENIAQAAQFVQSGNAQAGIIALSLAVSPAMRAGRRWEIPQGLYPPIEQAAIILKSAKNKSAARAFLDLITSDAGRQILAQSGFALPARSASRVSSAPPR